MKIQIIAKGKLVHTWENQPILASQLLAGLWNTPEPDKKKLLLFNHKDTPKQNMLPSDALAHIKDRIDAGQLRPMQIPPDERCLMLLKIKFSGLKRRVGIKLYGPLVENAFEPHGAVINLPYFLKNRHALDLTHRVEEILAYYIKPLPHPKPKAKRPKKSPNKKKSPSKTVNSSTQPSSKKVTLAPLPEPQRTRSPVAKPLHPPKTFPNSTPRSFFKSPAFHAGVLSLILVTGLFFMGFSLMITLITAGVMGLALYSVEKGIEAHWQNQSRAYQQYRLYSDPEIQHLSPQAIQAFKVGYRSDHWAGYCQSTFSLPAWTQYQAFNAGMMAHRKNDVMLKGKIDQVKHKRQKP